MADVRLTGRRPARGTAKFTRPVLTYSTLDNFAVRAAILKALKAQLGRFHGTLLDVGSGNQPYKSLILADGGAVEQYSALDIPGTTYSTPSLHWDGLTIPLKTSSVDCAMATEVLEHCPAPALVLDEVYRVLKPGGVFFFTVPFLWPLHDVPHDEFRFTPFALRRLLDNAGFSEIELCALGGWDASLAQMIGLWVRRRPMSRWKRAVLSRVALPAMRALLRRDLLPQQFDESCMITGLWGTAAKPKP